MGRVRKNIDWKAFEDALNRNGKISKTCLEFEISDVGLKQYLNVRGLKLVKLYDLKRIDESKDDARKAKEIDYKHLLDRLNNQDVKGDIAREFGMEWNLMVLFLKRRNLQVIETFRIVEDEKVPA